MAYGTRYTAEWIKGDKTGTLLIEQKDYVGASEKLTLVSDAINITQKIEDWESHIMGSICEFNIYNNKADYFTLLDLMIAKERKYRITVTCDVEADPDPITYILFSGFINTEAVTQRYLKNSVIHLVASNFISKLEYVYPTSLNTFGMVTFIDIILEIL
jgi:hypothetical protein